MRIFSRRDPEAARRRYAWHYFMSHYSEGRNTSTGVGYVGQVVLAVSTIVVVTVNLIMIIVMSPSAPRIIVMIVAMLAAFWWLIHAINCGVDLAIKANKFADQAVKATTEMDEVKSFFDEQYPWLFH